MTTRHITQQHERRDAIMAVTRLDFAASCPTLIGRALWHADQDDDERRRTNLIDLLMADEMIDEFVNIEDEPIDEPPAHAWTEEQERKLALDGSLA